MCRRWLLAALFAVSSFVIVAGTSSQAGTAQRESLLVYFGTYTRGESQGIYLSRLNLTDGSLSKATLAAEVSNPSFLAIHPSKRYLYSVNEDARFKKINESGGVSAFALETSTGKLTPINQQPSGGAGPCHIIVDPSGGNVLVANYGGGSVSVFPLREDGRLGKATAFVQHEGSSLLPRQKGPHAHSINVDAGNRFAVAADLGLDKLLVYRFDAEKGTLQANEPAFAKLPGGAGPRHFAFHPSGRFAYVINEINRSVTAFAYDGERGALKALQTVPTLPPAAPKKGSTAEVQVHPSGKFLYGSNRGHDSIVAFSIDPSTGKLTYIAHQSTGGKTPRGFGIDPTGQFLLAANQASDSIVVFRINQKTGALKPTGHTLKVASPVCVKMLAP